MVRHSVAQCHYEHFLTPAFCGLTAPLPHFYATIIRLHFVSPALMTGEGRKGPFLQLFATFLGHSFFFFYIFGGWNRD